MGRAVISVKNSIKEIKGIIDSVKNDAKMGLITGIEEINFYILQLSEAVSRLSTDERRSFEPQLMEIIVEMRKINDQIDHEMSTLSAELKAAPGVNFDEAFRKIANENRS